MTHHTATHSASFIIDVNTDNAYTSAMISTTHLDPDPLAGDQLFKRLDELATISEHAEHLTRTYLTATHREAATLIERWMQLAGMNTRMDAVGNVIGRYEGQQADSPALMLGSHYDTVQNAGQYDGMYGVVVAIGCVEALHRQQLRLPHALEIIAFADEEGVRFNATLIGSRAIAGTLSPALLDTQDAAGITMKQALDTYGLDSGAVSQAAYPASSLLGYAELHIEQGPVLIDRDLPVGVVTAIAGASRFQVTVTGLSGHAGTVPMPLRQDAAAAAAEMVLLVERLASGEDDLTGTVGVLEIPNGATNVIAGSARFTVDMRSGSDTLRQSAVAELRQGIEAICTKRNVTASLQPMHDAPAVQCDTKLTTLMTNAVEAHDIPVIQLPSGAGHDAMAIAELTPVTMLFVRCGNGGISHHPDETMTPADAETGGRVLLTFLEKFGQQATTAASD